MRGSAKERIAKHLTVAEESTDGDHVDENGGSPKANGKAGMSNNDVEDDGAGAVAAGDASAQAAALMEALKSINEVHAKAVEAISLAQKALATKTEV